MDEILKNKETRKKIIISIIFGFLGFVINFYSLDFIQFTDFKINILIGLIFPLLITQFWGWKYGLLSAIAGGCQTMWYLWYTDGYGMLYSVPVFTLWIVWHGYWADIRRTRRRRWYHSMYIVELAFRIVIELGFLTIFSSLISLNPPFWDSRITMNFVSVDWYSFVIKKHIFSSYILLLFADALINIKPVRKFFTPQDKIDYTQTTYVISIAILFGLLLWLIQSAMDYFVFFKNTDTFLNIAFVNIPLNSLFTRNLFLFTCLIFGVLLSHIILKLRRNEMKLRKSETHSHSLMDTCPDLVFTLNLHAEISYMNAKTEQYFENSQQLIGKSFYNYIAPGFLDITRKNFLSGISGKITPPYEIALNTSLRGMIFFEIHANAIYESDGSISGRIAILRDISEHKKFLKEINEKNQFLNRITETNPNAIVIVNAEGIIIYANHVAKNILGISKKILNQAKYDDLEWNITDYNENPIPREKLPFYIVKKTKKNIYGIQHVIVKENQPKKFLSVNAAPVLDEHENFLYMVASLEDITQKKQNEMELDKYRSNLEKLVIDRTSELEEKNINLQHYLKLFQDREFRIKELRDKITELEKQSEEKN